LRTDGSVFVKQQVVYKIIKVSMTTQHAISK
jgi:hypothetical protein